MCPSPYRAGTPLDQWDLCARERKGSVNKGTERSTKWTTGGNRFGAAQGGRWPPLPLESMYMYKLESVQPETLVTTSRVLDPGGATNEGGCSKVR